MKNHMGNIPQTNSGQKLTSGTNRSSQTIRQQNQTSTPTLFYGGKEISFENYLAIPTFIRQSKMINLD